MTATILLIRHAAHAHLGRILSGRIEGVALSGEGEAQAAGLTSALGGVAIDLLQSSPVQRARQTATAIAATRPGLAIEIADGLDELDFGDWAGMAFTELAEDPRWHGWNEARSAAVAPGGESMAAAQDRVWAHIETTALANPGCTVAMVSHCDIIRAAIARVLGVSLDRFDRFDIDPASISALAVGPWGARVRSMNGCRHE